MKVSAGQYMSTLCLDMSMLCLGDVEFLSSSLFPVELSRPGLNVWFIFCSRFVFSPDAGERDLRRSAVERASDPTSSVENPIVLRLDP